MNEIEQKSKDKMKAFQEKLIKEMKKDHESENKIQINGNTYL